MRMQTENTQLRSKLDQYQERASAAEAAAEAAAQRAAHAEEEARQRAAQAAEAAKQLAEQAAEAAKQQQAQQEVPPASPRTASVLTPTKRNRDAVPSLGGEEEPRPAPSPRVRELFEEHSEAKAEAGAHCDEEPEAGQSIPISPGAAPKEPAADEDDVRQQVGVLVKGSEKECVHLHGQPPSVHVG